MRNALLLAALFVSGPIHAAATTGSAAPNPQYLQWVEAMKDAPRGPFSHLRWFCNDGTVHPPKPYPCKDRGDGYQHGEWSDETRQLRDQGYKIANLLAGIDAAELTAQPDFMDSYGQILVERFLLGADDGWILRRALFYRGAIQEEDERDAARQLLMELISRPEWLGPRFAALRIGAQLLPHGDASASAQKVRQVSAALADQDPAFQSLRAKIHGAPDAGDAARVRDYAAGVKNPGMREKYLTLAKNIDAVYQAEPLAGTLRRQAEVFTAGPWLQKLLRDGAAALEKAPSAAGRFSASAKLLADLRDALPRIKSPSARLRVLDLSLKVETENFRSASELRDALASAPRIQRVEWLGASADAAYGTGMINRRQREELARSVKRLTLQGATLGTYLAELRYLGRVPGWGTQGLRFHFFEAMQKLGEIEPLAMIFVQDQLRGSPLLFYSAVLDSLLRDANQLAGVKHRLFGEEAGAGLRALNAGLARGVLHAGADLAAVADFDASGIYLLPETVAELPPVAGILTAGEGNPLSHVQLLARNLGIPNVSVDESLQTRLRARDGKSVVLAVSPSGLVELEADGPRWDAVFGRETDVNGVLIQPDMEKLDLSVTTFISLDALRAADSGRIVGPKAAKLGELRHHYPEAVARGLAIPFGAFRERVLDRAYKDTGNTVFQWMTAQYDRIQALPQGSEERRTLTESFRAELYEQILGTDPGDAFRAGLRAALATEFGAEGGYGVFVRSDTNVEDLPGFTGAGLNLTVPNAVGLDQVMEAIPRVWASPFTARAFAWRQSLMSDPEHVYPAILLLESVPSEKSGVLVTQDLATGDRSVLSVAVNEGVGGAVDGQAAESLRIDTKDGSVRVLASATAPWRRLPSPKGGVDKLPASGGDTVLQPDEIRQLIQLAQELPERFPPITDDQGKPAPADIEFGFLDGKLRLFQIRPFLESRKARGSDYLTRMDRALEGRMDTQVDMQEVPAS